MLEKFIDQPAEEAAKTDGRRKRSARSREKIIEALLALVRGGDVEASAQRVADKAGVSLRTVFRHFDEVDMIYKEITGRIEDEVMPMVLEPYTATDWRGRVMEVIERRARLYEHIMMLKLAGWIRRFGSETLMDTHNEFVEGERTILEGILPKAFVEDRPLFDALDTALSFEAWRRYRQDLDLSPDEAQESMVASLEVMTRGY